MKQVLTFIFSAILALSAAEFGCAAQNYVATPVTISSTTVERDGKVYYEHKVVDKQTLYSISKAYDVYIDEIYAANPGLKESGLKKGTVIYIPMKAETAGTADRTGEVSNASVENTANSASLDKNSNTSAKAKKSAKEPTEFEKNAAEKKAARTAEREKRKARQRRNTPNNPEENAVDETPAPEVTEPVEETPTAEADSTATSDAISKGKNKRPEHIGRNDICATLLLPLNAGAVGSNDLSMDFYSGALLAAKDLSEDSGISLYINVFDSYGDVLPDASELSYSDFVVGLLSKDGFNGLLENVPKDCLVVSPLDMNTLPLTERNANFYQCSNSTTAQYADMAQWLAEDMEESDRILVIHEKSLVGTEQAEEVGEALNARGLEWSSFSYSILDGRNITSALGEKLTEEGSNRVVIATSNEAFANDALRNLNVLIHNDFDIVLYGGSKIRGFENIPVENLHNVNFHSSLSFYTDYDDPKVQKFLMEYRALFNTEPSQTAFQGYDVMYYFTITSRRVGAMHFVERPKNTPMLMSDFEFEQVGKDGGHVRTGIRRTVYEPDYSITYLK